MPAVTNGVLDSSCPVNWDWPGNRGLVGWWTGLPLSGWGRGLTCLDVVAKSGKPGKGNGTLTNFLNPFTGNGSGWAAGPSGNDLFYVSASRNERITTTATSSSGVFTLSGWYYLRAYNTGTGQYNAHAWFGSGTGYGGLALGPSAANLQAFGSGASEPNGVNFAAWPGLNRWVYQTWTRDASNWKVYFNGVLAGTLTSGTWGAGSDQLRLLGRSDASQTIDGTGGDFRLFNYAQSSSQVAVSFQQASTGYPDALRWASTKKYFSVQSEPVDGITGGGSVTPPATKIQPVLDSSCPVNWDWPGNRGLVGWWSGWPLSGWSRGGKLLDAVGYSGKKGYNGTPANSPTWVGGGNGFSAPRYNGSNQYHTLGTPLTKISSAFTLLLDVTSEVPTGSPTLGHQSYPVGIGSDVAGITYQHNTAAYQGAFYMQGSGAYPAAKWGTAAAGERCFIAATWDGSTMRAYKNGVPANTASNSTFGSTSGSTYLGSDTSATNTWPGLVHSFQVINYAMSAAQVREAFRQSKVGYPDALKWVSTKKFFNLDASGPTIIQGSGTAAGSNTATGASVARWEAFGVAAGLNLATGASQVRWEALGTAAGANAFSGASVVRWEAFGVAAGSNTATGTSQSRLPGSGSAAGSSTATGSSVARWEAFGVAAGSNTSTGASQTRVELSGTAAGGNAGAGASDARWQAFGLAVGSNYATGYIIDGNAPPAWVIRQRMMLKGAT